MPMLCIAGALDAKYKTTIGFCEFKHHVAEQLVAPWLQKRKKKLTNKFLRSSSSISKALAVAALQNNLHVLMENKKRNDAKNAAYPRGIDCHMCVILGTEVTCESTLNTTFGCFGCGYRYHPRCFALQHHRHLNPHATNSFIDHKIAGHRKRAKSMCVSDLRNTQIQINLGV